MRPQPLGLRCSKQPPRRRGGDRGVPGGFGSPEGVPIALPLAGSPCGAPAAAGLPCGPPEDVPPGAGPSVVLAASAWPGRIRFRPCGLRRLPGVPRLALRPSSVLPVRFPALRRFREPRSVSCVECFDCLERGELYGPRPTRSTPRFRRSEHEHAGSGPAKKSDNSQRNVSDVTAHGERAGQRCCLPPRPAPEASEPASTSS